MELWVRQEALLKFLERCNGEATFRGESTVLGEEGGVGGFFGKSKLCCCKV